MSAQNRGRFYREKVKNREVDAQHKNIEEIVNQMTGLNAGREI